MRMPLNPRLASDKVEKSLGLEGVIIAPVKKKTAKDAEPKPKKKAAAGKKTK